MFDRVQNTPLVLLIFLPLYYWWNKQEAAPTYVLKHIYPFIYIKVMIILCNFQKLSASNGKTSNKNREKKYIIAKHPLHSEPSQISMMEFFTKRVGGWKTMTVFAKRSPLGVCPGSEYISSLISLKCLFFSIYYILVQSHQLKHQNNM